VFQADHVAVACQILQCLDRCYTCQPTTLYDIAIWCLTAKLMAVHAAIGWYVQPNCNIVGLEHNLNITLNWNQTSVQQRNKITHNNNSYCHY
jgi:hypothetical protein